MRGIQGGVRIWAQNALPLLGLGYNIHTPTNIVCANRMSGMTSGRGSQTAHDGMRPSSEPSATQNAQIRAWEQRTDHPSFQRSLCSNRLYFAPVALLTSSLPTTTTTPHKLTHLTLLTKSSLKWLALRYVSLLLDKSSKNMPLIIDWWPRRHRRRRHFLIANRPQVHWRLVTLIAHTTISIHILTAFHVF